jgi:GntR family transcriptional regulator/MocR family aminotransferase
VQVPIVLNRRARVPLHRQIYDQWRDGILSGRFAPGERIPSTRELADLLHVSRATVTTAYDQLTAEGYCRRSAARAASCRASCRTVRWRGSGPQRPSTSRRWSACRATAPASRPRHRADVSSPPGALDLSKLSPDLDAFPIRIWRRLVMRHVRSFSTPAWESADRGAGYEGLRREIASYLRRTRAVRCEAGQVIVVSGSQQALDLCARVLVDPGDVAAVEDPCYPGARQLFEAHGARLHPVPVKRDGGAGEAFRDWPVSCSPPAHQLPTGASMLLPRRLELLDWARARGVVVIEDDYDSEYNYSGAPLALQGPSAAASVIYVGTFSNVMFPGSASATWWCHRRSSPPSPAPSGTPTAAPRSSSRPRSRLPARGPLRAPRPPHAAALRPPPPRADDGAGPAPGRRGHRAERRRRHVPDGALRSGRAAEQARRQGVNLTSTEHFYLGRRRRTMLLRFSGVGERTLREGIRRLAICRPPIPEGTAIERPRPVLRAGPGRDRCATPAGPIHAASALAATSTARAPAKVDVARLQPVEERGDEARGPQAQTQAGGEAERQHHRHAAEHEHEDAEAIGAEGDAHADLRAPHVDGVGDDAVEADRREQQRQPAEEPRQQRDQAFLRQPATDELIEVTDGERRPGSTPCSVSPAVDPVDRAAVDVDTVA